MNVGETPNEKITQSIYVKCTSCNAEGGYFNEIVSRNYKRQIKRLTKKAIKNWNNRFKVNLE